MANKTNVNNSLHMLTKPLIAKPPVLQDQFLTLNIQPLKVEKLPETIDEKIDYVPKMETTPLIVTAKDTRVVCVKVNDIRPKYNDLGEWMDDPNNVYIARKGVVFITRNGIKSRYPEKDSIWANPYKIGGTVNRENVVELYRNHIINKIRSGEISCDQLEELRGKNLGCWCKEKGQDIQCHGDILLELLELNAKGQL